MSTYHIHWLLSSVLIPSCFEAPPAKDIIIVVSQCLFKWSLLFTTFFSHFIIKTPSDPLGSSSFFQKFIFSKFLLGIYKSKLKKPLLYPLF